MRSESRTGKSIKNISVILFFKLINVILQFFSRKIFIKYLGTEILGLNTTATNLLQFLNLAELGIGSAIGFSLYKPLYDKNEQTINEIVALQGKLYKRIAYVIIAGALILMCFFPWIFAKMPLPLWYAYASFGVLLFSTMLGYFVNYKQVVLSANQQEYKIFYSYGSTILVKTVVQIFAIKYFDNGYVWWCVWEVVFAIIASYNLNNTVKRTFPFLAPLCMSVKELNEKYPTIKEKIKQLFVHKIGTFALSQSSPIIIYAFASLSLVTLYGNYMLIFTGFVSFSMALTNCLTASVGNLVAEGKDKCIMSVFEELFSLRFIITAMMCFCMTVLVQPFITLWIGKEYVLPISTVFIIVAILYIQVSRHAVDTYISAYGFYSDIWAPAIEAILNIGLSILLGYLYGLNGILSGVLISLIIVVLIWKPLFLFGIKLKYGLLQYIKIYIQHVLIASVATCVTIFILYLIPVNPYYSIGKFILYSIASLAIFSLVLIGLLYLSNCGIRKLCERFVTK